jgi:hypothetical protein
LLASGKFARAHVQAIAKPDEVDDVVDAPSAFSRCHSPRAKSEPDVLGDAHVGPERKILKHHANAAQLRRRVNSSSRRNDLSIQPNLAAIGCNRPAIRSSVDFPQLRRPCRAQISPLRSDNSVYLAGRECMIEGMCKAGVPEG